MRGVTAGIRELTSAGAYRLAAAIAVGAALLLPMGSARSVSVVRKVTGPT